MIAQELVKVGQAFKGANGEIRHVICLHKLGRGYGVTWDSIPMSSEYYGSALFRERNMRPNGYMTMREFQKWAAEHYRADAQEADSQRAASRPDEPNRRGT